MKKAIITLAVLLAAAFTGRSQQIYDGGEVPDGYRVVDTVIFSPVSSIDTTLTGLNVWNAMPEGVSLEASSKIRRALEDKIKDAPEKTVAGYRKMLRICSLPNTTACAPTAATTIPTSR